MRVRFPASRIRRIVDTHDAVMRKAHDEMSAVHAIVLTRFWDWYLGYHQRTTTSQWKRNGTEMQVNLLRKEASLVISALHPRANRITCSADPMDRGDTSAGTLAINTTWGKALPASGIRESVRLATLFPGCAYKVGYDAGPGSPVERTWVRILPPWEVILDRDVTDIRDERYRGHVYHAEKEDVEERFPALAGRLRGAARRDFFESMTGERPQNLAHPGNTSEDGEFVRVLEFLNLKDTVSGKGGNVYTGRLEVWVLDQGEGISESPVSLTPFPFADAEGRPLLNIEPLAFDNEPGFPLRPVAPIVRMLPQQIEINLLRTRMMEDIRRNSRKVAYADGAISEDELTKLLSGVDMEFIKVKLLAGMSLGEIFRIIEQPPIAADTVRYTDFVMQDFRQVSATSPNAKGEITDATAREVDVVLLFTQNEMGDLGLLLMEKLVKVARLIQRALIGAMLDTGESSPLESSTAAVPGESGPARAPSGAFTMKDRERRVEITVESLNADFGISFVEGGRTPLTDQAMMSFLSGPTAELYFKLWDAMLKGTADAVLAERIMAHLAEVAGLPKDLHPEELRHEWEKVQASRPAAPPAEDAPAPVEEPVQSEEPAAPPRGNPVLVGKLREVFTVLSTAAQSSPEAAQSLQVPGRAVAAAMKAAEAGDVEAMAGALTAAHDALTASPVPGTEEAVAGIEVILKAVARTAAPEPSPEPPESPESPEPEEPNGLPA